MPRYKVEYHEMKSGYVTFTADSLEHAESMLAEVHDGERDELPEATTTFVEDSADYFWVEEA